MMNGQQNIKKKNSYLPRVTVMKKTGNLDILEP